MTTRKFTNTWFNGNIPAWNFIFSKIIKVNKPLVGIEIGSYEGQSSCWIADNVLINAKSQLICIDTFSGSEEHSELQRTNLKERFEQNIKTTQKEAQIRVIQANSFEGLLKLNQEKIQVDFIYIDGSHRASDVLSDAVLSINLLKKGGVIIFDDYTWNSQQNPILSPKIAVDAFLTIHNDKLQIIGKLPSQQIYALKTV